jgi:hypothetical protein
MSEERRVDNSFSSQIIYQLGDGNGMECIFSAGSGA